MGIAALILFLLLLPLTLTVRVKEEGDTTLCLRLLGIPLFRIPERERPVHLRDYSKRAMERRAKKQARKAAKKKPKKADAHPQAPGKETSLSDKISFVTDVARDVLARTLSHARVKIKRLTVTVGSPDAAKTALLYGSVTPAVSFLLETLEQFSHLKIAPDARVGVQADFTAERCRVDLHLRFRLLVVHLIRITLKTLFDITSRPSKRRA